MLQDSDRVGQNLMHAGDEANYSSKGGRTLECELRTVEAQYCC